MLPNFSQGPNPEKGIWQFQDAKAKLSEVLNRADKSGKQVIIRNKKHFVIMNEDTFNDYSGSKRSSIDVFLRCPHPDIDLDLSRSKETLIDLDL